MMNKMENGVKTKEEKMKITSTLFIYPLTDILYETFFFTFKPIII